MYYVGDADSVLKDWCLYSVIAAQRCKMWVVFVSDYRPVEGVG